GTPAGARPRRPRGAARRLGEQPHRRPPLLRPHDEVAGRLRRERARAGRSCLMADLATDVLVIGSGARGAGTAAPLASAGGTVTVLEEGPWVDAASLEPFSLDEMVAKYRHHGLAAAFGNPAIAYAEGRCVGGSTEINSGLYHRLPDHLADEW